MNALSEAGIYVMVDLTNNVQQLNGSDPAASYNAAYLENAFAVVDIYQKYNNTLAFFAGSEVITSENNRSVAAAPYLKATVRDIKSYIALKNYRSVPVGYAATNDDLAKIVEVADYLNAGPANERVDFFGLVRPLPVLLVRTELDGS